MFDSKELKNAKKNLREGVRDFARDAIYEQIDGWQTQGPSPEFVRQCAMRLNDLGGDANKEIWSSRSTIKNAVDSVAMEYFSRTGKVLVFDKKAEAQVITERLTQLIGDLR